MKRHPQQQPGQEWLGPQVEVAPRDADTRQLILAADAIVGFQTTAIFEAAVASRPVLYPAWGPVFEGALPMLLPFHAQPGLVTHVKGPAELAAALGRRPSELAGPTAEGRAAAEEQLGPVDGRAAERVLDVLRLHAGDGPTGLMPPGRRRLGRAAALAVAAPGLRAAGAAASRLGRPVQADAAVRRAAHWLQEGREAWTLTRSR